MLRRVGSLILSVFISSAFISSAFISSAIVIGLRSSVEAQQVLDSAGRYICSDNKVFDLRRNRFLSLASVTKTANGQVKTLNKKIRKTPKKKKKVIKRLQKQIANLRAFVRQAQRCVAGQFPSPTPTPAGPTPTPTLTPTPGIPSPQVAAGFFHTCTNSGSGTVQCFGDNNNKQLGIGSGPAQASPSIPTGLGVITAKAAAGGGRHSCAAPQSGGVLCWGDNSNKQATGNPGDFISQADPGSVAGVTGEFVQVVAGDRHTCAVQKTGGVVCWGQNSAGQTGSGLTSTVQAPTSVVGLATTVTKISTYANHTCAVLGNGSVQCWGLNSQYPLGTGDFSIRTSATTPINLRSVSVVDVATGNDHTCIVYRDGVVQCVGQNEVGQMGQGSTSLSQTTFITVPLGAATAVAAGDDFTCAIVNSGAGVSCWGKGTSGQLGNGQFLDRSSPVAVQGLSGTTVGITAGQNFACALASDGTVRCWGDNVSKQLGSTGGSSAVAVLVSALNLIAVF